MQIICQGRHEARGIRSIYCSLVVLPSSLGILLLGRRIARLALVGYSAMLN
jgi:hypothetical protein